MYVVLVAAVFVAGGAVFTSRAAEPAAPAGPTTLRAATIGSAYADLASPDPARRSAARTELMGLARSELPALRRVVETRQPVSPQQAIDLRDIVRHVYLASDPYERSGDGFLGLATRGTRVPVTVELPDGTVCPGVDFTQRYPGFCAYRWLQAGDVILSIGVGGADVPLDYGLTLTMAVKKVPPGTPIALRVLRGGLVTTLRFPVDARPKAFDTYPNNTLSFMTDRSTRADDYWRTQFAPLVDPDLT
jgi:hypothetical protein